MNMDDAGTYQVPLGTPLLVVMVAEAFLQPKAHPCVHIHVSQRFFFIISEEYFLK